MRRGFSLPGVMALCLFTFALFLALNQALRMNRHRLSIAKHREAAVWLAVSGVDWAQAEIAKGQLKPGQNFRSPDFQQGHFEVRMGPNGAIVSKGVAAGQSHTINRKPGQR
ncbi:MAG: hypothetical protein KC800_03160 [Candidatus Eremiobacteraeota bacterium]|nr:hypothetical protein [Candidatus Eremiobacteraeota bacterium]